MAQEQIQAKDPEPAPEFPSWPLNCMAFYNHLAEDYFRFLRAIGAVTSPAEAVRAGGAFEAGVANDLTRAWCDLALSPITAMTKVMSAKPPS